MRTKLKLTEGIFPMPVLMIATYNEDGSVNVMNAAWGTMVERDIVALNLSEGHKTVQNIKARGAFTVSIADAAHVVEADYFGMESGNRVFDKLARSGLTAGRAETVDAPVINEFPLCLECEFIEYQGGEYGCGVIGRVVNVTADERVMDHDATVRKHFSPSARDKDQCRHACGHAQADGGDGAGERLHDVVERKAGLDLAARAVDEHLDGSDGVGALQVEQVPDEDGGRLGVDGAAELQLAVGKHLVTHVEAADALAGLLQDLRLVKGVDGLAHGELLPEVWPVAGARPDSVWVAVMVGCHIFSLGCGASAAYVWAVSVSRTLAHRPDGCTSFFWREGHSFGAPQIPTWVFSGQYPSRLFSPDDR